MNLLIRVTTERYIGEYPVPAEDNRKFVLNIEHICGGISIPAEVFDGKVTVFAENGTVLYFDKERVESAVLKSDGFVTGSVNGEQFALSIIECDEEAFGFVKYDIGGINEISVGRNDDNDIRINSNYVGRHHCRISRRNGGLYVTDSSTNGTYINGKRIDSEYELEALDVIYAAEIKIIIAGNCLAVNKSSVVKTSLRPFSADKSGYIPHSSAAEICTRSPRAIVPLNTDTITIEDMPRSEERKDKPAVLTIGPSLTMPLPIIASVLISSGANASSDTMLLTSVTSVGLMAALAVMWMLINRGYTNKEERLRRSMIARKYEEYLSAKEKEIIDIHGSNKAILERSYPDSASIISNVTEGHTETLWNRNPSDPDFMNVRIGKGYIPFQGEINVPERGFSVVDDVYSERRKSIAETYSKISDAVCTLDLNCAKCIGIIGKAEEIRDVMYSIAVQITSMYDGDTVKTVFIYGNDESGLFDWSRWLPHTREKDGLRLIADTPERVNVIMRKLEMKAEDDRDRMTPTKRNKECYVIFSSAKNRPAYDRISNLLNSEKTNIFMVLGYGRLEMLPADCHTIIDADNGGRVIWLDRGKDNINEVALDKIPQRKAEAFARYLFRISDIRQTSGSIPDSVTLMQAAGIGVFEKCELEKRYKLNRAFESINILLGTGKGGEKQYIDIHESKDGPHGLVAGMTGAGKSELLQTMVINAALNYSPDELAFLFIDYKGGGMADAFRDLPHNAGIITNISDNDGESIDTGAIQRALVSVTSERIRRQELFRKYGVNHIDAYQKMYRSGIIKEPLPHLIIICDEFAELKVEQPDFIREIVRTSRVGRSLGIHLILATQKPAGAVDSDIFANSRFRICLRVQDNSDSYEMLHRNEAAELTVTGRAYLQIGNNEKFELFQTAYSGAEYTPVENDDADSSAVILNKYGEKIQYEMPAVRPESKISQLDAAVTYISGICRKEKIKPAVKLWLDPLPDIIEISSVLSSSERKGSLVPFGIADIPAKQRQETAYIDLKADGNMLTAGNSGSGKTTFWRTVIYSAARTMGTDGFVFYILDCEGYSDLSVLPHCGYISSSADGNIRILNKISEIIRKRRSVLENRTDEKVPHILVVADDINQLLERQPEIGDRLLPLMRDCRKYNISFAVSANSIITLKLKLLQVLDRKFILGAFTSTDLRDIGVKASVYSGSGSPGMGVYAENGTATEFRAAIIAAERECETNILNDREFNNSGNMDDYKIVDLPTSQKYSEFYEKYGSDDYIPVGYYVDSSSAFGIRLSDAGSYVVSCIEEKSLSAVFDNMVYALNKQAVPWSLVSMRPSVKFSRTGSETIYGKNDLTGFIEMLEDHTGKYENDNGKKIIIIDSLSEFCENIYSDDTISLRAEKVLKTAADNGILMIAGADESLYLKMFNRRLCQLFVVSHRGIHLGGRVNKQSIFDFALPFELRSKPQEFNYGYTLDGTKTRKIFIPLQ